MALHTPDGKCQFWSKRNVKLVNVYPSALYITMSE